MKVTIGINTAQYNYPFVTDTTLHLFEHLMKSLRKQTYKDFEVVVADVYYSSRSSYFKKNEEVFEVKHVSIKPNIWIQNNSCAISTTKNTFLLYAKGDIIVSMGDCVYFDENFIQRIVDNIDERTAVCSFYNIKQGDQFVVRDSRDISDKEKHGLYAVHGNVSMTKENWELVNGYDEMFDGAKGLEDVNLGNRIYWNGIDVKLIEPEITYENHYVCHLSGQNYFKCQHMWYGLAEKRFHQQQIKNANSKFITDEEFENLKLCINGVPNVENCYSYADRPCQIKGFYSQRISGFASQYIKLYCHPSLVFNLKEQRKDPDRAVFYLEELCKVDEVKEFLK